MTFDATTLLEVLRILLVLPGGAAVMWGVYDMFGDSGQQSSSGAKKIFGGIAFAAIAFLLMTWAIKDVGTAMGKAEASILLPNISTYISGLLRW